MPAKDALEMRNTFRNGFIDLECKKFLDAFGKNRDDLEGIYATKQG